SAVQLSASLPAKAVTPTPNGTRGFLRRSAHKLIFYREISARLSGAKPPSLEARNHRYRKCGRPERPAEISSLLTGFERAIVSGPDPSGGGSTGLVAPGLSQMIQHHDCAHQKREWIGNALPGNVRRRTVNGLENRVLLADVGPRRDAEPADQT